ncbi:MAG TPA: hypothetical protein GX513_10825 [Firmicutes bacterium]|nr:hypothetical protein [Bacillota bacterium]
MPLKKGDWVRGTGDESYAEYMLRARRRFEQGQVGTVRQVRQIYRRAAETVREDIRQATPGTLRYGHLKALAKVLEQRARSLTSELLEATQAGIHLASREAVSGPEELVVRLVEGTFDRAEVRRLFAAVNERAVLAFLARTGPDGLKLSDRVWRVGERYRNAIVRVLEDGIARGEDARKLAVEVQRYLQPGVWTVHKLETRRRLGVSADVSYEAMRLVRTEMNNAFHEATILANRASPSYLGIYWRLSGEHPFPDVCDDYARHNGDGFWPRGQEPVRPHPQCFCYILPRHERPEEFAERLRQWLRDPQSQPHIENWYNSTARVFLKRPYPTFLAGSGSRLLNVQMFAEPPKERIERLVAAGKIPQEAINRAEALWHSRLREGVFLPNGERLQITLLDLYHAIVDPMIWRRPERIESLLLGIFEIREGEHGRRVALSRWKEDEQERVGYAILGEEGGLRTLHVVDEKRIRREMRRGQVLWRR